MSENTLLGRVGIVTITSVDVVHSSGNRDRKTANCVCDCGKSFSKPLYNAIQLKSCGCKRGNYKYDVKPEKVYRTWRNMKNRCKINAAQYKNYAARGIIVCSGFDDFNFFKKIIGEPPSSHHSIDRIDNDANYSCGSCNECIKNGWGKNVRWATSKIQAENRRMVYKIDINGVVVSLKEACRINGLPYKAVHLRVKAGWAIADAITLPLSKPHSYSRIKQK
jgi:hypothetical protein